MEEAKTSNIELKLGDIIQIGSPTNSQYHQNSYFIEYIDEYNIEIIDISTLERSVLTINDDKLGFTDESIIYIALLKRNPNVGFAKQNGLNVHTWIDIQIGGDYPKVFTGEITNIQEDMIEITTHPEKLVLNIDFEYKGVPKTIPIEFIKIREKPKDISTMDENVDEIDIDPHCEISRPQDKRQDSSTPDVTIEDTLQDMYRKTKPVIQFGDDVDDIKFSVEIPENEKVYNINIQTNDLLDELLSAIPPEKLTYTVEQNIHSLIERFKQLRYLFSVFDEKLNIKSHLYKGPIHKPIVENIASFKSNHHWILPVVSHKRNFYSDVETDDVNYDRIENILVEHMKSWKQCEDSYKSDSTSNRYSKYIEDLNKFMLPFISDILENKTFLTDKATMRTDIDTIVDNIGDFSSSVETTNIKKSKKFAIQRYICEPNDNVTLKSLLTLPQQFVTYSHITLPNTNILKKAELSNSSIHMYRLLNENTQTLPYIVSNLDVEVDYVKENLDYLNKIIDFSIDDKFMEDKERFIKLLKVVLPSTSTIIDDYVKHANVLKMSFIDIVKMLEPYHIYHDDICYHKKNMHFDKIRILIEERIDNYIANYEKNKRSYQNHKKSLNFEPPLSNTIERLFLLKEDLLETLQFGYNIEKEQIRHTNTSEFLQFLYSQDGTTLLADLITYMNVDLHSSEIDILKQIEPPKLDDMGASIKSKDCSRKYLAKRYTSMNELQDDQDTDDIYYDKDLDDTPYDILKKYKNEKETMSKDKFREYLKEILLSVYDVQKSEVDELCETLIEGKKRVQENEYAVLNIRPKLPDTIDINSLSEKEKKQIESEEQIREKIGYYKRVKKQWVFEPNIDPEVFIDTNTLFCNIQPNCLKNVLNNQCESSDFTKQRIEALNRARMVKEFDSRITSELANLNEKYEKQFQKDLKFNKYIMRMNENQRNRYNNFAYEYGKSLKSNEVVLSPYLEIRDSILGERDFVKKQSYILKFRHAVCRESLESENPHYFYCKETDTKLLPTFYYELATAYLVNRNYNDVLAQICSRIGTKSDDGDSIVDEHSGELIMKTKFVKEVQYTEDGYEIQSDAILDTETLDDKIRDAEQTFTLQSKNSILYENEQNGRIFNIMSNISNKMGIPVEAVKDFVFIHTNNFIDKIPSKAKYEAKSKGTDGKKQISYEIYKNRLIIWTIASCVFIKIQTQIPSMKVRKTFPGCNKSFKGYPLSDDADISGIQYLACVLKKIAGDFEPWNSIHKFKVDVYVTNLKTMIEKLIKNDEIRNLYVLKREDLESTTIETIPSELQVQKWTSFLPPLVSYHIRELRNVTKEFEKDLLEQMKTGNTKQHSSINIMKSKCVLHGYGIIELINNIVKRATPLLQTVAKIPFLENACCDTSKLRAIDYFIQKDDNIRQYINIANEVKEFIERANAIAKPPILFHNEFTGITYPPIVSTITEEIIYHSFIHYCNLNNNRPIPIELKHLMQEKIKNFPKKKPMLEQVEFMKRNNKAITRGHFDALMQIIRKNNIIDINETIIYNEVESIRNVLDNCNDEENDIISKLRDHLYNIINNHEPNKMIHEESEPLIKLKNYLARTNIQLVNEIVKFLKNYGKLNNKNFKEVQEYLMGITKNNMTQMDSTFNITSFIKTSVYNMSKVFPTMIFEGKSYYDKVHQHWGLSEYHKNDLHKFMENQWKFLAKYNHKILRQMMFEITERLRDVHVLMHKMPVQMSIQDNNITYYPYMDDEATLMLYSYFWYSCIYEYIHVCHNEEYVKSDIEEKRVIRRKQNDENNIDLPVNYSDDEDITEVDLVLMIDANLNDIKQLTAELILDYIHVEKESRFVMKSYKEISEVSNKMKFAEKETITNKFSSIENDDEREVLKYLKNFKIGEWNIGMQKHLTVYNQEHYDSERHKLWSNDIEYTEDLLIEASLHEEQDTSDDNYHYLNDEGDGYDFEDNEGFNAFENED